MKGMVERESSASVQYVAAVDSETLEDVTVLRPGAMIALAAVLGSTRLIDNVVLS